MSYIKGQNLRIGVKTGTPATIKYIAASTSCSLHLAADLEETVNKDTVTDGIAWKVQEVVGKNWDCSVDMQLVDADSSALKGFDILSMVGTEVDVEVNLVNGSNNRTKQTGLYTGKAIITDWSGNFAAKQTGTVSVQLQGNGALTKVA